MDEIPLKYTLLLNAERELLKKYVAYVGDCEGTDFISTCENRHQSDVKFTEDEWKVLEKISKGH